MRNLFNRYFKKYDAWYDKNKYAYLSELRAVRKVLPKKGRGLEIGVGTGRFAAPLGIKFGIDPSKNMIRIAQKRGVYARLGYGEALPYRSRTFDYVAIIITLCFVKDPQKVLREASRILKENGKLIIGIIDKDSFLGKDYQEKDSVFYKNANFFSVKDLPNLLTELEFSKFFYYQTLFRFPNELDCVESPKRGFGMGGFVVIRSEKSQ